MGLVTKRSNPVMGPLYTPPLESFNFVDKPAHETNFSDRIIVPEFLVIHYTGGASGSSSANWFSMEAANASAQVVIARNGTLYQCVPFDKRSWHAGKSAWGGLTNLNSHSIGLEFANYGLLEQAEDQFIYTRGGKLFDKGDYIFRDDKYWEVYTEEQYVIGARLARALCSKYDIPFERTHVVGHEEVAPERKIDPGPAFDWDRFMAKM